MLDSPQDLRSVLTQPFNDFNLVHTDIPEQLQRITETPYNSGTAMTCVEVTAELEQLDHLLGPEAKAESSASKPIISRETAERNAWEAARSAASLDSLPRFRPAIDGRGAAGAGLQGSGPRRDAAPRLPERMASEFTVLWRCSDRKPLGIRRRANRDPR